MNELKLNMIRKAREAYADIFPCTTKGNLEECFTLEGNQVFFWFNTPDKTTHMMMSDVK